LWRFPVKMQAKKKPGARIWGEEVDEENSYKRQKKEARALAYQEKKEGGELGT